MFTIKNNKDNFVLSKYLDFYNLSSLLGWSSILYLTVSQIFKNHGDYRSVCATVFPVFCKVQTAAILEPIHVLLGLVRAPLTPTTIQLLSRLFLTWGVSYSVPEISGHWSFTSMLLSWSIAEMIRFGYHVQPFKGTVTRWARYNAFIILFPWGFLSEMMLCYKCARQMKKSNNHFYIVVGAIATLLYTPGFPLLYAHMFKQRTKYLKRW